jgi:RNA polymerase sigma-70 factor (ECF subfamily)
MSNSADSAPSAEITILLRAWSQGDENALSQLVPIVYEELRSRAHYYMSRERPGHILQTTGLVNEVYLKLLGTRGVDWQNRTHFFALSARLMRRILTDIFRHENVDKGPGGKIHVSFDEAWMLSDELDLDVAALDEALTALAVEDERKSQVIELRFFGGRTVEETAEVLGVSAETVKGDFRFAKSWLRRRLNRKKCDDGGEPAGN